MNRVNDEGKRQPPPGPTPRDEASEPPPSCSVYMYGLECEHCGRMINFSPGRIETWWHRRRYGHTPFPLGGYLEKRSPSGRLIE